MAMVVVSFVASLWIAQRRLLPIDERAATLIENVVPSMDHLAAARSEVLRIGIYAEGYASGAPATPRAEITSAHERMQEELDAFRRLPPFAGEEDLLDAVEQDTAALSRALHAALQEPGTAELEALRKTLEETSESIHELQLLYQANVSALAADVMRSSRHASTVAVTLGASSLAIALVATALTLRVLRSEARLAEAQRALLERRARELEAFSGRVAHDLKDPLGGLALALMLARSRASSDKGLEDTFARMERQVARLSAFIDSMLDFARASAAPEEGARADVRAVLGDVMLDVAPLAEEAGARLDVRSCDEIAVACSPAALTSMIANLVRNAIKHGATPERPPRIEISVHAKTDTVCVEVEDDGPGIPPDHRAAIFEPFKHVPGTSRPGVGIGLPTVKRIAEAYGGRAGVRSTVGRGSTFFVELPRRRPS